MGLPHDYDEAIRYLVQNLSFQDGIGKGDEKIKADREATIANAISVAMRTAYFKRWLGGFMCYSGKRWVRVQTKDDLPKIIYEVLRQKDVGIVYRMPSVVGKTVNVVNDDKNIRSYKGDKRYISFRNCVLDMTTRDKLEFSEKYESVVYLDFDYDPDAECKLWDLTIKQIITDNASVAALHEFLGLVFVDRSKLNVETMLWLIGTGSNGKGVVYDMIKNILGDNCSSTEFMYLCTHSQAEYYRASIAGKLLNFCSDMGTKEFSNGIFKAIVSHEEVTCRQPGEKSYDTKEMPLLAASVNKMPVVTDSTDGFWRRCKFIHFPRTFSEKEQDKLLKFKLRSEISGVFNRILAGMDRILLSGGVFTESAAMIELGKKARIESNSVLSWCRERRYRGVVAIQEMVELGVLTMNDVCEKRMFASEIMKDYAAWCHEFQQMPKSRPNLNEDLKSDGFVYKERMRLSSGGGVSSVSSGFIFYQITKEEVFEEIENDKVVEELPF